MEKSSKKTSQSNWRRNSPLNFSIGLVLSLTLVITAFEWNFRTVTTPLEIPDHGKFEIDQIEMMVIPHPPQPKPDIVNPDDIIETNEPVVDSKVIVPDFPIEPIPAGDEPDLGNLFTGDVLGKEKAERPTYEMIPAEPIGGEKAFYEYLYSKVHYPADMLRGGTITVKFVVNEKGEIDNIQIVEGFNRALEKEIIRVLKEAPAWKPARIGAKRVKTPFEIPFSFNIE